jgi:hypothetical protein
MEYSRLPAELTETDARLKEIPKDNNGKVYEPLCNKYYPLEYGKAFGIEPILPCLFKVNEIIYNGNKPVTKPVFVTKSGKRIYPDEEGNMESTDEPGEWQAELVVEPRPVALKDGYAYVSTGVKITLDYTGIPVGKNSLLIPGVGPDYGALLGGFYRPATPRDGDLMMRFPYQNTVASGQFFWLQSDSIDLSTLSPSNIAKIPKGEQKPILVEFEIFEKFKLNCGFPKKCGQLTDEEIAINGKCGLEAFLNSSIRINKQGISPDKLVDYSEQTRIAIAKWREKIRKKCNEAKTLFPRIELRP